MATISWWRLARFALLFVGFSSLGAATQAATYYVSPSGSNSNPGTLSAPFQTLQKAHDIANAGDTIYMRGGTYPIDPNGIRISRGGSSGNPISVFNYPGDVPVLDGIAETISYNSAIDIRASFWHFKGLEIKNAPFQGIYVNVGSSDITVELCNVHHNVRINSNGQGINVAGSTGGNIVILNNDVHHNGILESTGLPSTNTSSHGDGIGFASTAATGNIIRGNRVWRNNDDGIDLWAGENILVDGNWVWESGILDNGSKGVDDGEGIKLGGGTASGGHRVQNNLVWKNKGNGFTDNSSTLGSTLYNNTSWANYYQYSFYTLTLVNVLKNNLAFQDTGTGLVYLPNTSSVQQNNSWNLPVTVNSAQFVSLDYSAAATTPRNADGSLPTLGFLHLAAGSNLIDKGVDVGLPYSGSAPDLGAYEFSGALPAPTNLRVVAP